MIYGFLAFVGLVFVACFAIHQFLKFLEASDE